MTVHALRQAPVIEEQEAVFVESPSRRAWRRLVRRRGAMVGLAIILLMILVAVFAPLIAPYDPAQQSWTAVRKVFLSF